MRSTIDLSFDGGNYFGIKKEFKENDLKKILATSADKGKFAAPKDLLKIQNHPRGQKDLGQSFYDQNLAKTGVRRFVEPSEGDSIFNFDRDIAKKAKLRDSLGQIPKQSLKMSADQQDRFKEKSPMRKQLESYKNKPEDVIQDAKRHNYKRMHKQSAYTNVDGYKCHAIQAQMKNVTRKRAILDAHHDPLKQRIQDGHFDFIDVESPESQNRRSFTSLKELLEKHKAPSVTKQSLQPAQTSSDFKTFKALPIKKRSTTSNQEQNKAALEEVRKNYMRMRMQPNSKEMALPVKINIENPYK